MKRFLAYLLCLLLAGALLTGCANTTPAKPAEPEASVTEEAKSAESSADLAPESQSDATPDLTPSDPPVQESPSASSSQRTNNDSTPDTSSAPSGRPLNEDRLRDITSGYWYQKIQDFNTFQFKPDGTWYSLYSDEWAGTYTLSGNHLDLYIDDVWWLSLEYLPLNELEEKAHDTEEAQLWVNLIHDEWNYSGHIFYEVDFVGDGFDENAFYLIPATEDPFA